MKRGVLAVALLPVWVLVLAMMSAPLSGCARDSQMPHLIQTVTEQELYEGLLSLGLLENPILETEDCETAYENVKECIVRIGMGNAHGSGVIWEMTPDEIVIATNKHVLEYWDDKTSYVHFPQGYFTRADILGVSDVYDVGFLRIENREFDYETLKRLRYVRKAPEVYQTLKEGDAVFCIGSEEEEFYPATVEDRWHYIDEFDEYMIYGYGYARPGMSGGGTFDGRGNFIGMLSGGTSYGEIASVPLTLMLEAYEEIRAGS